MNLNQTLIELKALSTCLWFSDQAPGVNQIPTASIDTIGVNHRKVYMDQIGLIINKVLDSMEDQGIRSPAATVVLSQSAG